LEVDIITAGDADKAVKSTGAPRSQELAGNADACHPFPECPQLYGDISDEDFSPAGGYSPCTRDVCRDGISASAAKER
jgi:hypothetical protein